MSRTPRLIVPGVPHHVTQRGNYQQAVFGGDQDRALYLDLVSRFLPRFGVALEGYCLMSNHVHLVATPYDAPGLPRALQQIQSCYARALHLRLGRSGHLWQARFFSTALDEEHFGAALLYVERNPVRAGLVPAAAQWPWSSAGAHTGTRSANRFLNLTRWQAQFDTDSWQALLENGEAAAPLEDCVRAATRSGSPLGSRRSIEQLRQTAGRSMKKGSTGILRSYQISNDPTVRMLATLSEISGSSAKSSL
jgi:putative transposase